MVTFDIFFVLRLDKSASRAGPQNGLFRLPWQQGNRSNTKPYTGPRLERMVTVFIVNIGFKNNCDETQETVKA